MAVAATLSVAALAGGVGLAVATGQPVLAVLGVILALAPWGAVFEAEDGRGGGAPPP